MLHRALCKPRPDRAPILGVHTRHLVGCGADRAVIVIVTSTGNIDASQVRAELEGREPNPKSKPEPKTTPTNSQTKAAQANQTSERAPSLSPSPRCDRARALCGILSSRLMLRGGKYCM